MRYLILLIILASCRSEKHIADKAIQQMRKAEERYNAKSKVDTAGNNYCYTYHPVNAETKITTKYIKGKPYPVKGETKYLPFDCDSAIKIVKGKDHIFRIPVPVYLQVDTNAIIREVTVNDTRKLDNKQAELDGCNKALKAQQDKTELANKRTDKYLRFSLFGLLGWLLLIVGVVLKIKNRL